jgi:hypothetical protein
MRSGHPDEIIGLNDLISHISKSNGLNLSGIEIGSWAGESARIFASSGIVKSLVCIDPWMHDFTLDSNNLPIPQWQELEFDKVAQEFQTVIRKVKDSSENVFGLFKDDSMDFIYIDGSHKYEDVSADLRNYIPKIKVGGWVCGHDYSKKKKGVMIAVDELGVEIKLFKDTSWCFQRT